jgi:homoserine dehydrogenase
MQTVQGAQSVPTVRLALLGCGTVGSAFAKLVLEDGPGIAARAGVALELAGVAVAHPDRPRPGIPRRLLTGDATRLVADPAVDVVVELIGGLEPARQLVTAALRAKKPVVSANKELLAAHGAELAAVAEEAGVDLLYEAAAAGAIPLIRPLRESLAGERIRRVIGIVNGTTNYILTRMTEDALGFDEALREAKRLGFAERDPSADVEGHDAAAKAAILASLAFRCQVVRDDVVCEGISGVRALDVAFARQLGYVVKPLAIAEWFAPGGDGSARGSGGDDRAAAGHASRSAAVASTLASSAQGLAHGLAHGLASRAVALLRPEISVRVHSAMVPVSHPLAAVRGPYNAVFIEGEACGELMLYGRGAGGLPTASAVLGDVLDAAHHLRDGAAHRALPRVRPRLKRPDDLRSAWYLALDVVDRPGVLARVAAVFGRHGVSIRSMEQVGLGEEARLIFLTHVAREGDVRRTVEGLRRLEVVEEVGQAMRVLGDEELEVPADRGPR